MCAFCMYTSPQHKRGLNIVAYNTLNPECSHGQARGHQTHTLTHTHAQAHTNGPAQEGVLENGYVRHMTAYFYFGICLSGHFLGARNL